MESNQLETGRSRGFVELRHCRRLKLEVEIKIRSRSIGTVVGHTVDISESGIAAMLKMEVPENEVVLLEFSLPDGLVEVQALVRQRSAFRYGFQFVEQGPMRELIARACRQLSIEQD